MSCGRGTGEDKTRYSATCTEVRGCKGSFFLRNVVFSKFSWGLSVIFPCGNYCSNYRGSNYRGNGTFGVTALFELSHSHTISYRNKKVVPFPLP